MANSDKNIVYTQNDFLVVMSLSDKCGLQLKKYKLKMFPMV